MRAASSRASTFLIATILLAACGSRAPSESARASDATTPDGPSDGAAREAETPESDATDGDADADSLSGLPACAVGDSFAFGVCVVSDQDVLPLPSVSIDVGVHTSGVATVQDVGTGPAPASCQNARVFGARHASTWWIQLMTADGHLWTVGVQGLGDTPLLGKADTVSFEFTYRGSQISGFGPPEANLQLSRATDGPLLWAHASNQPKGTDWLQLVTGKSVCAFSLGCGDSVNEVTATVNGATATLAPFGTANIGGYAVGTGRALLWHHQDPACADYMGDAFDVAAAKIP
jgi:hypothetical protein